MTNNTKEPRKPRKMPKNQRAYPKKGKPRLVEVNDAAERAALIDANGSIGTPQILRQEQGGLWADAKQLAKWRALRNPPTSGTKL